jgi:sialic acid synthase SpsE
MDHFYNQIESIVSVLQTRKRIVLVGKGASLALINETTLHDAFVVNLNDSERYIAGQVTLFYADWVVESLRKEGFKNSWYVTPQPMKGLLSSSSSWMEVPYHANNNENLEHLAAYFESKEFILGDFLLLSAIKLIQLLLQQSNLQLPVYLVGFDFEHNPNDLTDLSGHDTEYKRILLRTQQENFKFIQRFVSENKLLTLYHVGQSEFSTITVAEFNQADPVVHNEPIASTVDGKPQAAASAFSNAIAYQSLLQRCDQEDYCLVVAELTNNHIGDANRLRTMIRAAKKCGADMIKVQKRDVETFYTKAELATTYRSPFGNTLGDYRRGVELDDTLMQVLIEECATNEIVWFASILDSPSLQFIEAYHPPLIKLPSTISNHRNFLKRVADMYTDDLVISTGFTDASYEEFVFETFAGDRKLFLLQCTSSYPAPPEACQIAVVRHYEEMRTAKGMVNLFAGYSSHDLGSLGSMMAVAAGARMVEKHVKLGNLEWIHFDGVALDLQTREFEQYVHDIRKAQRMCGSKQKQIHQAEHHKYVPNEKHN